MPFTSLDFNPGLDFTAINPATGGDHNSLVELATPKDDRGILLYSIDTALNTPNVPNANIDTKFQRYMWVRIPFAGATNKTPQVYAWNNDAPADATFLKWIDTAPDTSDFEAIANQALTEAQAAAATANTALVTANTANATATTALSNANDAVTTANNVADDATNALASATDALANSTAAQLTAADALSVANAATATAQQALNEVQSSRALKYVCIVEQQNANVSAGANVAGANVRQLNTEKNDAGNLVTVAAGVVTFTVGGTYRVKAWAVGHAVTYHQLYLVKNADNSTLIIGRSTRQTGETINLTSELEGLITVVAADAVRLDHYFTGTDADGQGKAGNIGPADKKEIYALLEMEKLN